MDEVVAFFDSQPYDKLRRYLLKRFAHYGIDISHLHSPRRRGAQPPRPEPDELRQAVAQASSVAGALRILGRPCTGQMRGLFHQWTEADDLDTSHFLGQAHQRGKQGPTPVKRPEDILVRHVRGRRTRTHLLRRALHESGVPEECADCGVGAEWLGKPMTLEVDHTNGDWGDDRIENLRLLCPNCHATTSTWCRGGKRSARS
ncbi:HNH endonuclease [Streptomyces sp. NPDC006482]|uniref:HNH endonuclease signature motif containing protein n=1 Tax=unclassified Streptomyces TaxID=2593676 RepID=UPI0022512E58|nr:HNH endonuclease [Streptomyces sp. NBC_00094]MCX5390940.1 HNH endonuclease [Streptomyces sp. NBC_00094]